MNGRRAWDEPPGDSELLTNAIKYPRGRAGVAESTVEGDEAVFRVEDTGV
jgi:signal transduction histidine kinase